MRIVEYPFYMANVLCVINSSVASRRGSPLVEYGIAKIKNGKGTQSNAFELNAEPQLSQT